MTTEIINRKGARKAKDIPKEVIKLLNEGKIESVNLTEWLAIDHVSLIKNTFPEIGISSEMTERILSKIKEQKKPSTMNTVKLTGSLLYENFSNNIDCQNIFNKLNAHKSDSIRCYAPYLITLDSKYSIEEKLELIKKLVSDKHFGVREIVWMSIRPEIDKHLKKSIKLLSEWAKDEDENVRRFTTESTRPRGVWCKHIETLKQRPEMALSILNKLKADKSKYVQDSLGNWLNDASKSKPNFVIELCKKWKKESPVKETEKIIKRARRTVDKK